MTSEEKETFIQRVKRELIELPAENTIQVSYNKVDIYKIIPHRPPFDFLSSISAINLTYQTIEVQSNVAIDDPVFAGHFPDEPVYPGVFQIETMGQAGLCLAYFVISNTTNIDQNNEPVKGLFTRVHNAGFVRAIKPGDQLTIRATLIENDDFFGILSSQVLIGQEICSHSILEVYYP